MKTCTKCHIDKQLSEFYKEKCKLDGLQSHCKKCDNARKEVWKSLNPDLSKLHMKIADANRYIKHKSQRNALSKLWKKNNPHKVKALDAKRRASQIQRMPKWLTDFEKLRIECRYAVASMLTKYGSQAWHVDHVIPLQGKLVSGLHVPENLRIVPAVVNLSKGNKFNI